ncbi:hypothetical protein L1887_08747 [Cichorium endivia]|nr:hypothetical protein L1887_08747 [Cichorium endivia]
MAMIKTVKARQIFANHGNPTIAHRSVKRCRVDVTLSDGTLARAVVPSIASTCMINGGSHTGNKLAMQELMILPIGASSFKEAMKWLVGILQNNDGSQKISGDSLKNLYKSFVVGGDDLLVTNLKRVEKAIKEKTCNALLLKDKKRCVVALRMRCIRTVIQLKLNNKNANQTQMVEDKTESHYVMYQVILQLAKEK